MNQSDTSTMSTFKHPVGRPSRGAHTLSMMGGGKLDQQVMMNQHDSMPLDITRNPFLRLSAKKKETVIRNSTKSKTNKQSISFLFP